MRKLDVVFVISLIAAGAFVFRPKLRQSSPSQGVSPVSPSPSSSSSSITSTFPALFAGVGLGDQQAHAVAVLGAPTKKYGRTPQSGNWIYEKPAGSLDLYWVDGELKGIQCSVKADHLSEVERSWRLAPWVEMGCDSGHVRDVYGDPVKVRRGETVETWNYPADTDHVDIAVGFEHGKLLHLRMSRN